MNPNLNMWINVFLFLGVTYLVMRFIYKIYSLLIARGHLTKTRTFILKHLGSSQYHFEETMRREAARKTRLKLVKGGADENQ